MDEEMASEVKFKPSFRFSGEKISLREFFSIRRSEVKGAGSLLEI